MKPYIRRHDGFKPFMLYLIDIPTLGNGTRWFKKGKEAWYDMRDYFLNKRL